MPATLMWAQHDCMEVNCQMFASIISNVFWCLCVDTAFHNMSMHVPPLFPAL